MKYTFSRVNGDRSYRWFEFGICNRSDRVGRQNERTYLYCFGSITDTEIEEVEKSEFSSG